MKAPQFKLIRKVLSPLAPVGRVLRKIPHPPLRSKRGLLVLVILIAGGGAVAGVGTLMAVGFSETAGFCGMCHTMDPELKAYEMSAHKELPCAECHVEPGVRGLVKAKANGTKQLLHIITGAYPKPIPPPDHADMPKVKDTCLKCHEVDKLTENGGPVKMILKPRYRPDQANTRELVTVMLRPGGLGEANGVRGVHWHIEQQVTFTSSDVRARKIDLVNIKFNDGRTKQYIAGKEIGSSADVKPDVDRLSKEEPRRMDCMDCHNRVGHAVPSPDRAVDNAIAEGQISATLPFIKRDSVALLKGDYTSLEAADKAITGLRESYGTHYPLVLQKQQKQVTAAVDELKVLYRLIATPEMKVQAKTYPDNLGHQTSPGCFRCHDGAHYRVEKGRITKETIPSACSTCHTFPQIGESVSNPPLGGTASGSASGDAANFPLGARPSIALGAKPVDHKDKLYVFSHKHSVSKLTSAGTSCAACHTPSYCENCHKSGAIKVKHTDMLYNHANAVKKAGGPQACAYCHQPAFCERCHENPVLQNRALPPAKKGRRAP
jgi:nitrate/TMAO reductase-like tetraheme cytochrome c subunit